MDRFENGGVRRIAMESIDETMDGEGQRENERVGEEVAGIEHMSMVEPNKDREILTDGVIPVSELVERFTLKPEESKVPEKKKTRKKGLRLKVSGEENEECD